jgi:hypothetical protein
VAGTSGSDWSEHSYGKHQRLPVPDNNGFQNGCSQQGLGCQMLFYSQQVGQCVHAFSRDYSLTFVVKPCI